MDIIIEIPKGSHIKYEWDKTGICLSIRYCLIICAILFTMDLYQIL